MISPLLQIALDLPHRLAKYYVEFNIWKDYTTVTEPAHTWISSMGRSKYLNPVYQALQDTGNHDTGCTWLNENIDFYHPVATTSIESILGPCTAFKLQQAHETLADDVESSVMEYLKFNQ